jgi:DNA-binding XRE family transcriptional regulator
MSAHMRKHPIDAANATLSFRHSGHLYVIPEAIAEKYIVSEAKQKFAKATIPAEEVFKEVIQTYSKPGLLLKGLRTREGLSQIDFAKKIKVSQANLSKMENGKRAIGRTIAKRIASQFKVDYRIFLS